MAFNGSKLYVEMVTAGKKLNKRDKNFENKSNTNDRNTKLYHRYYYHVKHKGCNPVTVIDELKKEFSISEVTILDIVARGASSIKKIRDEAPTKEKLTRMYPYFNWK